MKPLIFRLATNVAAIMAKELKYEVAGNNLKTMKGNREKETELKENKLDTLLKRIGCGLCHLRTDKGYETVKQFATDHKLPLIQYWRMEKGRANITLKSLMTLLSIHGVGLDDFFSLVRARC
jgi:hypothetical protein